MLIIKTQKSTKLFNYCNSSLAETHALFQNKEHNFMSKFLVHFILLSLICSQQQAVAQSPPPTIQLPSGASPSVPVNPTDKIPIQSITPNSLPGSSPLPSGTTSDVNAGLGSEKGAGKYEEYQSICRENEYDVVGHYSEGLRNKRVTFLKEKIASAGESAIKYELRLAKEYLDQYEADEFNLLTKQLKSRKLSKEDNQYLNALISYSTGKISSARKTLVDLVKEEKGNLNNIEALQLLAEIYSAEGNYFEATAVYEDLNSFTKNAYLAQQCETMILNSLNAEGEVVCRKAVEKFPDNPFPNIFMGVGFREREDFKKANVAFKKSIAIKPTEMGYTCLAELHFMKNNFTDASEYFKKSLAINSDSERAYLGLAWTYLKSKKYSESIKNFVAACKINGQHQVEIKRAFKELSSQKISEANEFIKVANSCNR